MIRFLKSSSGFSLAQILQKLRSQAFAIRVAVQDPVCPGCGGWIDAGLNHPGVFWCEGCQSRWGFLMQPASLNQADALQIYQCHLVPRLKHVLYRWKFLPKHPGQSFLINLMLGESGVCQPFLDENTLMVTIPARTAVEHRQDRMTALASVLAASVGARFLPGALLWQRKTERQHQLAGRATRMRNVIGALALHSTAQARLAHALQKNQRARIVILDDILTTGSTLNAARMAISAVFPQANIVTMAIAHVPLQHESPAG